MDKDGDGSLTKQEISTKFGYDYEEAEELSPKRMESILNATNKQKRSDRDKPDRPENIRQDSFNKKQQENEEKGLMEEFKELSEKQLLQLPLTLFKKS